MAIGASCCGDKLNRSFLQQLVAMDYSRRQWLLSHVNHVTSFGVLLEDKIPVQTPTPPLQQKFGTAQNTPMKDDDFM